MMANVSRTMLADACRRHTIIVTSKILRTSRQPTLITMGNDKSKLQRTDTKKRLQALQETTNFESIAVRDMGKVFDECSKGSGKLTREQFQDALGRLESFGLKKFKNLPMGERLFDQFDQNKDGVVDQREFVSGFSILCKGTDDEKLELTFKVFDTDGNGYISKAELIDMYTQTYHALLVSLRAALTPDEMKSNAEAEQFQDKLMRSLEENFTNIIHSVTENIIKTLDKNADGQLNKEEFKNFVLANPFVKASYQLKFAENADGTAHKGSNAAPASPAGAGVGEKLTAEVVLSFLESES